MLILGFQHSVPFTPVLCSPRFSTHRLLRYNTNIGVPLSMDLIQSRFQITDTMEENLDEQTMHKSQVYTHFFPTSSVYASCINTSGVCTWMKETS